MEKGAHDRREAEAGTGARRTPTLGTDARGGDTAIKGRDRARRLGVGFPPNRSPAQVSPVTGGVGDETGRLELRHSELNGAGGGGPRGGEPLLLKQR